MNSKDKTVSQIVNQKRREKESEIDSKVHKIIFEDNFPFLWKFTDLDVSFNFWLLVLIRLLQSVFLTSSMCHPDEYWQSTQPAYVWVFGAEIRLPWEWSEKFMLRNTLYPMYLSLPLRLIKFLNIDTNFIVNVTPYLAHFPVVVLTDYFTWKVAKRVVGVD